MSLLHYCRSRLNPELTNVIRIVLQSNAQCSTLRYMSEIRNRSLRIDDENYAWLQGLPGRSLNEAIERLRLNSDVGKGDVMQCNAEIAEILDLVRSIAANTEIRNPMALLPTSAGELGIDNRPKNAYCKHCGNKFAGAKFATICPSCKSSGHTLAPAECPACNDGRAI